MGEAARRSIAGVGLGALAAVAITLASSGATAVQIKPGGSPDSRSDGRAHPSATALEAAQGLALGFRATPLGVLDDPDGVPESEDSSALTTRGANPVGADLGFTDLDAMSGSAGGVDVALAAVPEPSSLLVFATGILFGGWAGRARARH